MKRVLAAILLIVAIASSITVAFTVSQVEREEKRLRADIQYRSTLVAESLRESVEPNFINKSNQYLQGVVERFATKERFAGLAIYDNKTATVAASPAITLEDEHVKEIVTDVMDADQANGDFVLIDESKMYAFVLPLHQEKSVVGALMVVQNATYIDTRLRDIWKTNLVRLFTQSALLALALLLILRWVIFEPVAALVQSLKSSRTDSTLPNTPVPSHPFFKPLTTEVMHMRKSLAEARVRAHDEAKMRLEKIDSPWTSDRLKAFVEDALKGRSIYLVSNREPYIHVRRNKTVEHFFPASGMATALEPIMQACGGTWVAFGSGDADKEVVDKNDRVRVPPDDPKYTLRRVWLTPKEEAGYYYGFSNEGLWPLCHLAHTRPIFRKEDWEEYKKVNGRFAETLLSEIKDVHRPIILVQDYHFALLPRMIKKARPDATIGLFWHIPWPNAESFSICPYRKELLDGMLGADLLGFHTQYHCNNFIDTVGKELESLIDWEQFAVVRGGHPTLIKPFPISIAFTDVAPEDEVKEGTPQNILDEIKDAQFVVVGVDRLDYTKGILERLQAIDMFLEKYPPYRTKIVFVQVSAPSRSKIPRYQEFEKEVDEEVARINKKYQTKGYKPILHLKRHHSHSEIYALYRRANVCLVTSLHDGMNLVAKEFIATREDENGVLILSQFAGASRELKDALIVNPYNIEEVADSLKIAIEMMHSEQTRRMRRMRSIIQNYNVYRWSAELLRTLTSLV